jgi:hypothetical protein
VIHVVIATCLVEQIITEGRLNAPRVPCLWVLVSWRYCCKWVSLGQYMPRCDIPSMRYYRALNTVDSKVCIMYYGLMDNGLQTMDYKPWITNHGLQTMDYKQWITNYGLENMYSQNDVLWTTYYILHTTYYGPQKHVVCKPRIMYYRLQTTYYRLHASDYILQTTCFRQWIKVYVSWILDYILESKYCETIL